MTINGATYGSSILAAAGIVNIYEDAVEPYPTVTLEAAAGTSPRPGAGPIRAVSLRRAPPDPARSGGTGGLRGRAGPVLVGQSNPGGRRQAAAVGGGRGQPINIEVTESPPPARPPLNMTTTEHDHH